jgi:hypothetical protein
LEAAGSAVPVKQAWLTTFTVGEPAHGTNFRLHLQRALRERSLIFSIKGSTLADQNSGMKEYE